MTTDTPDEGDRDPRRLYCTVAGCDGKVEAVASLYLDAWKGGTWSLSGVADESADIVCSEGHHKNGTPLLVKGLSAFLETVLPGTTWAGSNPEHPLGEDTVQLQLTVHDLHQINEAFPGLLERSTVIYGGHIQQV